MASPSVESRAATARTPSLPGRGRRLRFAVRSMGRHWLLTTTVLALVSGGFAFVALSAPPVYRSSATLVISGDDPAVVAQGTTATRAPAARSMEQVARAMEPWLQSSASAAQLVEELGLVGRLDEGQGVFARARDAVWELAFGTPGQRAATADAVRRVRRGLQVDVLPGGGTEQTVVVSGDWSRPRTAQRLVARALTRWIEDRRTVEVTPLEDAVTVAEQALQEANTQVADLRQALGIPEDQDREVPSSSPLRTAAAIQATAAQRFGAARVALAAGRASFDHRYRIVSGADLPSSRLGSPVPLIAVGVVVAYLSAMAMAARADRRRGRVVEVWQVTERLGLPHLGMLR